MPLPRREFLKYVSAGAVATTLRVPGGVSESDSVQTEQKLHIDYQSNNPGVEYYFLGNGRILAALQTSPAPEYGTHCGLLVMDCEHFARKISTYLYHPERGLMHSRLTVIVEGKGYTPAPGSSAIRWEYPDAIPTIVLEWSAAGCSIREELFCPIANSALVRTIRIKNTTTAPVSPSAFVLLYPNLMIFDEYHVDRKRATLTARGYKMLQLFVLGEATPGDRHLVIPFGEILPGEERAVTVVLTLDEPRDHFERKGLALMVSETRTYWKHTASLTTSNAGFNHLFNAARTGMRAAVAHTGKMDGSIWQYNLEWVRDQSMVAVGSTIAGLTDVAGSLLNRMLTHSVEDDGKTVDSSRHRPPETMELDQNGELLYALWMYWAWTGNDAIIRRHWRKIRSVADYVLQPVFRDPTIGLLKNSREYWERDPSFGVKEGYELTYQAWNIVGLEYVAQMADHMKEPGKARTWREASALMKKSFLHHPKFALIEEGRFIKRRLADGEVQWTFEPPNRASMPPGMPLNVEKVSHCNPDAGSVTPIMLQIVDPKSPLALKTLESMELLWNQRWTTGGYARYNVTSEPDSPGPWPFASLFIARSYHEAGNDEKVLRVLDWLLGIQGGKSGAWYEFYGARPVPPLPPVGIVIWTWAELVMLFVHHMLGVRPTPRSLVINPRLWTTMDEVRASVIVHGHEVTLNLRKTAGERRALVNGRTVELKNGALDLPAPRRNLSVEMEV